jgi:hypothetical protein
VEVRVAVIYREITGLVVDAQGDPLATGSLKVKPRAPIVQGANFIAPRMAEVPVVDGEFDLSLAAPSLYEFLVLDSYGETVWNFQSALTNETSQPISLAELWTNRNDELVADDPFEIIRVSGDTYAIRMWLVDPDTGGALDLNTATRVVLTVDEREEPDDDSTVVFQLVGQVIDPDKGVVDFPITGTQAANLGDFFYNVTVSDTPVMWTADGGTTVDGTEGIYFAKMDGDDTAVFTTRDTTPVLQVVWDQAPSNRPRQLFFPEWPSLDTRRKFRLSVLCYMDESWYVDSALILGGFDWRMDLTWENEPGFRDVGVFGTVPDAVTQVKTTYSNGATGDHPEWVAGWVQVVFEWEPQTGALGTWRCRAWQPPAADPGLWDSEVTDVNWPMGPLRFYLGMMSFGTGNAEIAWAKLEYPL